LLSKLWKKTQAEQKRVQSPHQKGEREEQKDEGQRMPKTKEKGPDVFGNPRLRACFPPREG
jgi:hypothetical protein